LTETRIRLAHAWPIAVGCFTAAAFLFTSQVWIDYAYAGRRLSWGRAFIVALVDWELWALISPLVVGLSQRFPFGRERWKSAVGVHLPASLIVGGAKLAIEGLLTSLILGYGRTPFSFLKIDLTLLTYWLIVAATHVGRHYLSARERERRALQLETSLARAQVEALKMQLHPHFLFNTLNTIAGLMREDVEAADRMLAKLAELLRRTFETADIQELPLDKELDLLGDYLAIQQTRYGDRFRLSVAVSDQARGALVPTLILQPLVENAIRHGVAAKPGSGTVSIAADVRGNRLMVTITNDGLPVPSTIHEGFGLRNIRSRLAALHGDRARFTLQSRSEGGAVAVLELPAIGSRTDT
jgi:two-component system, LytTR family, sensor kinase